MAATLGLGNMGYTTVVAPCYQCKVPFNFNPLLVPSVVVNAATGKPIDDYDEVKPPADERVRMPLCRPCVTDLNVRRARAGLAPIQIFPRAYDPEEVG